MLFYLWSGDAQDKYRLLETIFTLLHTAKKVSEKVHVQQAAQKKNQKKKTATTHRE